MKLVIDCFKLVKGAGKSIGIYNLAQNLVRELAKENDDSKNEIIVLKVKEMNIDFVVIDFISSGYHVKTNETVTTYLCYGQNRLVIVTETNGIAAYTKTMCSYAVIPEADEILNSINI